MPKIKSDLYANKSLATAKGVLKFDMNGEVEVEDVEFATSLSGLKGFHLVEEEKKEIPVKEDKEEKKEEKPKKTTTKSKTEK